MNFVLNLLWRGLILIKLNRYTKSRDDIAIWYVRAKWRHICPTYDVLWVYMYIHNSICPMICIYVAVFVSFWYACGSPPRDTIHCLHYIIQHFNWIWLFFLSPCSDTDAEKYFGKGITTGAKMEGVGSGFRSPVCRGGGVLPENFGNWKLRSTIASIWGNTLGESRANNVWRALYAFDYHSLGTRAARPHGIGPASTPYLGIRNLRSRNLVTVEVGQELFCSVYYFIFCETRPNVPLTFSLSIRTRRIDNS